MYFKEFLFGVIIGIYCQVLVPIKTTFCWISKKGQAVYSSLDRGIVDRTKQLVSWTFYYHVL